MKSPSPYLLAAGFLFILIYAFFISGALKRLKLQVSSHFIRKTVLFFTRAALWTANVIKLIRDIFCLRLIEEGLIEGLLVNGTLKLFSSASRNPLRYFNGNVNYYLLVSAVGLLSMFVFL